MIINWRNLGTAAGVLLFCLVVWSMLIMGAVGILALVHEWAVR